MNNKTNVVLEENKTNEEQKVESVKAEKTNVELTQLNDQEKSELELESEDLKIDSKNFNVATFGMGFANVVTNAVLKDNPLNHQPNNQKQDIQKEQNVKDYKFNYSAITLNPIQNFYYHVSQTINEIVEDYFKEKFSINNTNLGQINNLTKEIKNDQKAIIDKKKELKITSKKVANGFIIFSFFLIIGLAFIPIFKKNRAVIKEFNQFAAEKNNIIDQNTNKRFSLIYYALSNIILKDVYEYVFNRYGIDISEKIPSKKILKFLNDPKIIDVYSGVSGRYKNTPFFDIVYRTHAWEDVVTSRTRSYPYTVRVRRYDSNNRPYYTTEIRYETLTAYHHEDTPFVYRNNWLMFLTNFEPKFSFNLEAGKKSGKDRMLENKNFLKKFNINVFEDENNKDKFLENQKISEFFTIKAQEDYLQWYETNNGQIFNFNKSFNTIIVENKDYRIDNLDNLNSLLINIGLLQNSRNVGLEEVMQNIKNYIFSYFEKFAKMFQTPLLSPIINREWYNSESKVYQIGNEYDKSEYKEDNDEFDEIYIINRMHQNNILWFNDSKRADKPTWFKLTNKTESKNKVVHYEYVMNSYWSRILVDYVTIFGYHVGAKIIPVPYRRFWQLREPKHLSFISFKNTANKVIMVNQIFNKIIDKSQYSNENLANNIIENFIWTNDPNWFENINNVDTLINIFKSFNELNKERQITLVIDEYGAYLVFNDVKLANSLELEKILVDIEKFFK